MAENWRNRVRESDRYLGRPTLTYRSTPNATSPGPMQLVNFTSTWTGCLLFCDHNGNGTFTLNTQDLTGEVLTINADRTLGPFILAPGTGVTVTWTDGTPIISAIVWEDTQGIQIHRLDELIRLLRAQNAAHGIEVAPEPPARETNAAQVKGY